MPKVDGFTVLEYMNQFRWIDEIPVVMISAADDHESIERCYGLGVSDYIRRPFDAFIVQRRVKNTLTLYANQKRLMGMVSDQIYRNQRDNQCHDRHPQPHRRVPQQRERPARAPGADRDRMLLRRLSEKTDVYHLTEEKIRLIVTASALHDIGKISIPESILNKPGRLTPEEFRRHPHPSRHRRVHARGADAVPQGAAAQGRHRDLPLASRALGRRRLPRTACSASRSRSRLQVVALADVYDALTSDRCYKRRTATTPPSP